MNSRLRLCPNLAIICFILFVITEAGAAPPPVDHGVVGNWQSKAVIQGGELVFSWNINGDGSYSSTVVGPGTNYAENGQVTFDANMWSLHASNGRVDHGTYKVIGPKEFSITAVQGRSTWERMPDSLPAIPSAPPQSGETNSAVTAVSPPSEATPLPAIALPQVSAPATIPSPSSAPEINQAGSDEPTLSDPPPPIPPLPPPGSGNLISSDGNGSFRLEVLGPLQPGPGIHLTGQFAVSNDGHHFAAPMTGHRMGTGMSGPTSVINVDGRLLPAPRISANDFSFFDNDHLFYRASDTQGPILAINGYTLPRYDVYGETFIMSPDGKHYACSVRQERGRYGIMVDGKVGTEKFEHIQRMQFSPDSKHIAWVGTYANGRQQMVRDDKEGPILDAIGEDSDTDGPFANFFFTADSQHLYYLGKSGDGIFVYKDGVPDKRGIFKGSDMKTADVKHVSYLITPLDNDHVIQPVIDDQLGPTYDVAGPLVYSDDGNHFAYSGKKGTQWSLCVDGKEVSNSPAIPPDQYGNHDRLDAFRLPHFSDDNSHFAYVVLRGLKQIVVHDGREEPPYDLIRALAYDKAGDHLMYVARKGTKDVMVWDGHEGKTYDFINTDLTFLSPDGLHLDYVAGDLAPNTSRPPDIIELLQRAVLNAGTSYFVQDGVETKYPPIATVIPTPDLRRVIIATQTNGMYSLAGEGITGGPCQALGVCISADDKHYAYCAMNGDQRTMFIDGKAGPKTDFVFLPYNPPYPDSANIIHFDLTDTLVYPALIDGKLVRITYGPR